MHIVVVFIALAGTISLWRAAARHQHNTPHIIALQPRSYVALSARGLVYGRRSEAQGVLDLLLVLLELVAIDHALEVLLVDRARVQGDRRRPLSLAVVLHLDEVHHLVLCADQSIDTRHCRHDCHSMYHSIVRVDHASQDCCTPTVQVCLAIKQRTVVKKNWSAVTVIRRSRSRSLRMRVSCSLRSSSSLSVMLRCCRANAKPKPKPKARE